MSLDIATDIKQLAEKKGVSLLWISEQIGMSKPGFYGMLNSNNIKVETLEKVAKVLSVPITYFFSSPEEKKKILEGEANDALSNLANVVALLGVAVVFGTAFNSINKVIKRLEFDSNYTKDQAMIDLKELVKDMGTVMEALSKHNSQDSNSNQ